MGTNAVVHTETEVISDSEREFLRDMRQGYIIQIRAIERRLGMESCITTKREKQRHRREPGRESSEHGPEHGPVTINMESYMRP